MDELTTTQGIVALAAAAVGLAALLLAVILAVKLRRLRAAQAAVLGGTDRDLVTHAEQLGRGFQDLHNWVEAVAERLDARMTQADARIDGCIAYRSLIRYDAYGEMSGRQSSSVALLDAQRSGVIVSSILHRDQARVYVKQIHAGESELELSPEEVEAIETALGSTPA